MNSNHDLNQFITIALNNAQKEAVLHKNGPLLIVAGAGSGKTRVITTRITHLIVNEGIPAASILALTFTNKAALEMKERIAHFLGTTHQLPFVGTFHAFCLRLLKMHSELLTTPFFSILDEDDQQKILQTIIAKNGLQKRVTAKQVAYSISQIKNQTIAPDQDLHSMDPIMRSIYQAYEQERKASKCLDFDDLLLEVVKLFRANSSFKQQFQQQIRHILIDEYQDTNIVQHELLKHMSLENGNLQVDSVCAVGDEDQSIYSWRGATVSNIMNFRADFPGTQLIKIEQNYRSAQPILDIANSLIAHNKNRNPKQLWSEKKATDPIRVLSFLSEYQEADAIAQFLSVAAKTQKLSSIAILYRTHFQSRALEEALLKQSIPYKIIGGIQFYERKEIKDMLAYLKLVVNPFDRASFFRVINCPLRGLGAKFEELFYEHWHLQAFASFTDIAQQLIDEEIVTGSKKEALRSFIALFKNLSHSDAPGKAVEHFVIETGYFSYLKEEYDQEEALAKIENVKELLKAIEHLQATKQFTISDFLDEVALMQSQMQAENTEKDPVMLMTLHAAKGLEFHTIALVGLEEGLLPSSRSLTSDEAIEEERRLFYVGITRAQERLLITYSRYRYTYGTMTDQRPSRFLHELPKAATTIHDGSYLHGAQLNHFFSSWIAGTGVSHTANVKKVVPARAEKASTASHATPLWKKHQPVSHATFGTGIIENIELRANGVTYLQIKFKNGVKKLESTFIKSV